MKILFISQRLNNSQSGARVVAERNYTHCLELFDRDGTKLISIKKRNRGFLFKWLLRLQGYLDGAEPGDLKACLAALEDEAYRAVFIDSSYFGLFAKRIKRFRPELRVVCFYHDVLIHWWSQTAKSRGLRYHLYMALYRRSERLSCLYTDERIVLTERDASLLTSLYGMAKTTVVPITLPDRYKPNNDVRAGSSNLPLLLFVGTNYGPNIEGIAWFLAEVKPQIRAHIRIVGSGMDSYRDRWEADGVTVVGRVPSLEQEYVDADAVVIPLFSGSGMKVKTCEAFMHGKPVFATSEALTGYDVDGVAGVWRCDTSEAFIQSLTIWMDEKPRRRFEPALRRLYVERYSLEASLREYRKVLCGENLDNHR